VPIPEYAANLKLIVNYIRQLGVQTIVLITPPPVHDAGRKAWQVLVGAFQACISGLFFTILLLDRLA